MITFEGSASIAAVEEYLRASAPLVEHIKIRIPTNLQDERAGGKLALTQFILTWAQMSKRPTLVTYIADSLHVDRQLGNLVEEDHGMCALLTVDHVQTARGESIDNRAFSVSREFYRKEGGRARFKGNQASILVCDHTGSSNRSSAFECLSVAEFRGAKKTAFVRSFHAALSKCFERSSAKPLSSVQHDDLCEIVYELFANAEEWGTRDLDGATLPKPIRGINVRIYSKENSQGKPLSAHARGFSGLSKYLERNAKDERHQPRPFAEISVFDNGIGLAQQFLGKEIDASFPVKDEYAAVKKCLRRHVSSSGSSTRGIGLFLMMRLLSKTKGFLRIRTGRLSLYRDFEADPYLLEDAGGTKAGLILELAEYMRDWTTEEPEGVEPLPMCAGALFTFWVPLKNLDQQLELV